MKLIPGKLDKNSLFKLYKGNVQLSLCDSAFEPIQNSKNTIEAVLDSGKVVYGINTGFGSLANTRIEADKLTLLQKNLVLSHACGTGEFLSDDIVRVMLALKINNLSQGYSGVRYSLIEKLLTLFNQKIYPCIPEKGSVGASGDLVPLAHLVLPLLGEGHCHTQGKKIPSIDALKMINQSPIELKPKEGLALLNGMQASNAIALKAFFICEQFFKTAVVAGSLTVDAVMGSDIPFDDRIHKIRGHAAQSKVATWYRSLLNGSQIRASHKDCERVQDPYSIRCQPQVMGACLHQMLFVEDTLVQEANAVSDNPLIFSETQDILSGGNFHGEIVSMACDNLALAIAEIGALSERRIALLIDPHFSHLPPFLVKDSGLNSGFMLAHVAAAACASDNKALSHPHSVDSLPTSANQEDHVSMATNGALRLLKMLDNLATILAIELLAACQGLEFRRPLKSSAKLEDVYSKIRTLVKPYEKDRYFSPDIEAIKTLVYQEELIEGFELQ